MIESGKHSDSVVENPERRAFLRAAPAAFAAGLALADASLLTAPAHAAPATGTVKFKLITATEIARDIGKTEAKPGNITLVEETAGIDFSMVLTTEEKQTAPEFEMHQHRDHIFQILEGSTVYEVGGRPQGGRTIGPGEWRGPNVEGATRLTLNKGDRLVIPRGTPHKRSTPGSVTLILISPGAPANT
jgi:mannose-6-phosphate isomerase-like protein (cupin superfamily)